MAKSNQIKVKQHDSIIGGNEGTLTSITNPVSGLTIVFARIGARMVGVSLAWCAPEDKFKRKKGVKIATAQIYDKGDFQFQLPMPGATNEQIVWQLTNIFYGMNFDQFDAGGRGGVFQQNEQQ